MAAWSVHAVRRLGEGDDGVNIVDTLLELRFKLSREGELGVYASRYDNAENLCVMVGEELDLILKELTSASR